MIKTTLGILDMISGLVLGFHFLLPNIILRDIGIYLIFKGTLSSILYHPKDLLDFIDSGIGIYIILISFGFHSVILSVIATAYLLIKGGIEVFGP